MQAANDSVTHNRWLAFYIVNDMHLNDELTLALFEAALRESAFHNYANRNIPLSVVHSNDGIRSDHNSIGVMQQQVNNNGSSRGWGDYKQAMDPEHAMREFVKRAKGSKNRGRGAHLVAQDVQKSAFADGSNYKGQQQAAQDILNEMKESCK